MWPFVGCSRPSSSLTVVDLPGAVGPQQAEHFAAADLEIHVVHGARLGTAPEVLEDLGQSAHLDDRLGDTGWEARRCGGLG